MKKIQQLGLGIANTHDWSAYQSLQQRLSRTENQFKVEALEYALQKILQAPLREATGLRLAKDIYRDGKKYATSLLKPQGKNNLASHFFMELYCDMNDPTIEFICSPLDSIKVITNAFTQLSSREKMTLYLKATGNDTQQIISDKLGIGTRQFRNLLLNAKIKLKKNIGFKEACTNLQFALADPPNHDILFILQTLLHRQ